MTEFQDFQRAQKKAAGWKKKAIERREEMEKMRASQNKLKGLTTDFQKAQQEEIDSLKRQLEISNQTVEKLKIENQGFKKKVSF